MPRKTYLSKTVIKLMKIKKFPTPCQPAKCNRIPKPKNVQNQGFLKMAFLGDSNSLPSGFIKSTAKTGLIIKATINDAPNVKINIVGR